MVLDRRLISVADPDCADPLGQWRLPIAERYECADGRYLQCQGASPGVAAGVLAALGHPEWTDEALRGITALPSAEDEERWRARLTAAFKQRTAAEWEERIAQHGGAGAVCRTPQEWADEPHAAASQIVVAGEPGGSRRAGPAVRVLPAPSAHGAAGTAPVGRAAAAGHHWPGRPDAEERDDGQAPLPLTGIRVVDLSIILAGPTCGRLLAELGADVIKVDPPGRATLPYVSPWGWLDVNRSKRSVLLDLGQPAAREVLWELIEDADVLVENFRAGKLEALGFGREAVFARNPRIVYTSLNAYDFGGDFTRRAGWSRTPRPFPACRCPGAPTGSRDRCRSQSTTTARACSERSVRCSACMLRAGLVRAGGCLAACPAPPPSSSCLSCSGMRAVIAARDPCTCPARWTSSAARTAGSQPFGRRGRPDRWRRRQPRTAPAPWPRCARRESAACAPPRSRTCGRIPGYGITAT